MVNNCVLFFTFIFTAFIILPECRSGRYDSHEEKDKEKDTLFLLHVLLRHGERTTIRNEMYPNDPYANEQYLPYGLGQLTNEGKVTSYNIGATLRRMYNNFLGKIWTRDRMEATTTDTDRTKTTIQLVIAGLYPPRGVNKWLPDMKWQPIPFNYVPASQDLLMGNKRVTCARYIQSYIEALTSPSTREIAEENRKLYKYTSLNTGACYTKPLDMFRLHFLLQTEHEWGLELLPWTKKVYPRESLSAVIDEYYISTATPDMIRSVSGHLLKRILDDTNAKINGNAAAKERLIHLYSGHEYNIAPMLLAMKVFYPHLPGYGANIIWEIHRSNGQYSIRILYQESKDTKHHVLQIPGCTEKCPIEKYTEILKEHLATTAETC